MSVFTNRASRSAEQALQELAVLRRSNLALLAGASAEDRQRVGVHTERGEESVDHMIRMYAGHDLLHLQQILRRHARAGVAHLDGQLAARRGHHADRDGSARRGVAQRIRQEIADHLADAHRVDLDRREAGGRLDRH